MTQVAAKSNIIRVSAALGEQTLGAAGATGTRQATFGATRPLVGIMLALKPAVTAYGYDTRGNRTTTAPPSGATTLGYDQANRLKSYGSTATYAYNGGGLRMSKTVTSVTSQFTWDDSGGLPMLLTEGTTSFIYGPNGLPIEQIVGSTATFLHQDQRGDTRVLTSSNGTVGATYTFDSYGRQAAKTGTATTPFGFAGEYADAESGLVYLRARRYDPTTAQFLSRDPIEALTGEVYGYAGGNPLNGVDPTGYDWVNTVLRTTEIVGGAVAIGAAITGAVASAPAVIAAAGAVEIGAGAVATAASGYDAYRTCTAPGGGGASCALGVVATAAGAASLGVGGPAVRYAPKAVGEMVDFVNAARTASSITGGVGYGFTVASMWPMGSGPCAPLGQASFDPRVPRGEPTMPLPMGGHGGFYNPGAPR